jgi:hypothetical protein
VMYAGRAVEEGPVTALMRGACSARLCMPACAASG